MGARRLLLDERQLMRLTRADDLLLLRERLVHGDSRARRAVARSPTCRLTRLHVRRRRRLSEQCPTEIAITSRREKELSDLGFLPLCHYKNTDYAVFFGAQTTQKPKKYDRPEANCKCRNLCARLAVYHGHIPLRALPEGDGAATRSAPSWRSRTAPNLAQPLDHELRQLGGGRRPGDPRQVSHCAKPASRSPQVAGSVRAATTRWRICGPGCRWRN